MSKWKSTNYTGVRYREHPERKHSGKPDRYFAIRYTLNGKGLEEGLGWGSEGMNAKRASLERSKLREAQRTGQGAQSLKEARELKESEELQIQKETLQHQRENITFDELGKEYLAWAKLNKKSWLHDEQRLRVHIGPVLGDKSVKDITAADIEKLKMACQKKGLAPATINHSIGLARHVFNWAGRFDFFKGKNPSNSVAKIKHDNKCVRFLTRDEAQDLLNEVKSRSEDYYIISMTSLYAGLRFGEIMGLRWADVDLENRVLHMLDPKNTNNRQAHLVDTLYDLYSIRFRNEESNRSPSDLVFPGRSGQLVLKVSNTFTRAVEELGFNEGVDDRRHKVTFHTLRRTFASWLALQGTSLYMIKELLGHRTLEMTQRYAYLLPDQKKSAVEEMVNKVALE